MNPDPGSQNHYDRMRQVYKGKKGYISSDAKEYNQNLRGAEAVVKQQGEGRRLSWIIILARGVVRVELMPNDWKCNAKGIASFVQKLPAILREMLGPHAKLPRHLFTDRGTGMYTPAGLISNAYAEAAERAGFHVYRRGA